MIDDNERIAPIEELKPGEAVDLCDRLEAALRLARGHAFQDTAAWEKLARALAKRFDTLALPDEQESVWRLRAEEVGALGSQSPINAARPEGGATIEGTWPANDLRRAFVEGAKWWEWVSDDATMWPADVRRAEAEAEKRFAMNSERK